MSVRLLGKRGWRILGKWPLLALALALAAAACGGEETAIPPGEEIVPSIPWADRETARYRLLQGEEVKGTAVLNIERRDGALLFNQSFSFPDPGLTDEVSVEADAVSLRPRRVQRIITGPEGERRCVTEYADATASVDQRSPEGARRDTLNVPAPSYDSWSDLFLWRTLAFVQGHEARYTDVLTCTLVKPQLLSVGLKVTALERITVPAGTFQTWRLEIRSGGRTQRAWYADDPARTLVRYDNGELVFELE